MSMELLPLDPSVEGEARELYLFAFPERERIPFDTLLRMAEGPDCRFLWISVDGRFSGLAYLVESENLVFLLYLAVSPGSRCSGLGSDAIWLIKCGCEGRREHRPEAPQDPFLRAQRFLPTMHIQHPRRRQVHPPELGRSRDAGGGLRLLRVAYVPDLGVNNVKSYPCDVVPPCPTRKG